MPQNSRATKNLCKRFVAELLRIRIASGNFVSETFLRKHLAYIFELLHKKILNFRSSDFFDLAEILILERYIT